MKMMRWAFFFIFFSISVLFICSFDTVSAQPYETVSSYILADLQYEQYPGFSRIMFASNENIAFVSYELQDPYRIVIDLIGVSFCELQEYVEYEEGLVKSIEIIETPYAKRLPGLDEYFYAVDYIIITPRSKLPFTVSSSEDEKVIVVDIGEKPEPSVIKENIIDYINIETLDDASLMIIISNNEVVYKIEKNRYPDFNIVLTPQSPVFTDLEEYVELGTEHMKSIRIVKDTIARRPESLDNYYYPVKYIVIEPNIDLPFDFYSNDDGTISILEIYYPGIDKRKEEATVEVYKEAELLAQDVKKGLLKQFKEEIKKESLLSKEKVAEFKKEGLEKRGKEISKKVETIGRELLKDLIVTGKGMLSLKRSQDIAIENNLQAKTLKEEVKLAKLKKRDAFRSLFPNVKLKASHTVGDVMEDIAFTEEQYGVEGEQALYQGGRLMNAYRQSKVNVALSEARCKKIVNDLDFKVAEAYYNIVTAVMNIRLQKELLERAEAIVKLANKRHEAGLSTNLEILNVKSRYNQIQFQLATAERDLALARFKLKQVIGLDISEQNIDLSEVDTELPFKIIDINLDECLKAASNNQPDIAVNKLLVESNDYGEKIAQGKEGFNVDLTGFYGRGDSYYNTEPKNLDNNWNIGLKVSKPFWFATPSYSFTKDKTSMKVGDTDRTGSTVNSGEIAILDKNALSVRSEIKEAKINKQKAENELIEVRRQAALEIKEAYYNYQESILQVKNALEKVRFHKEATKVAIAQASLNEALQSQLLEAMIQLVDEKSVYIKALSDYSLAIVKINKVIGIKDYFNIS
jgi:outer membrane protein TolC